MSKIRCECSHGVGYFLPCKSCGKNLADILLGRKSVNKKSKLSPIRVNCEDCGEGKKNQHKPWKCLNRWKHLRDNLLKEKE